MTRVHLTTQTAADVPAGDEWLSPAEAAVCAGFRFAKRRDEWRLGRWTARRLVAPLLEAALPGVARPFGRIEIRAAADGAPEVFVAGRQAGVVLSIAHRDGLALCAAAAAPVLLGCDLERIEPRSTAFVADYLTPAEQAFVAAAPEAERALLANLVWSAKESALKALRTGLRADTRTVEVDLFADAPPETDEWRPLAVHVRPERRTFHGWWQARGGFVLTFVAAPAPARPAAPCVP